MESQDFTHFREGRRQIRHRAKERMADVLAPIIRVVTDWSFHENRNAKTGRKRFLETSVLNIEIVRPTSFLKPLTLICVIAVRAASFELFRSIALPVRRTPSHQK